MTKLMFACVAALALTACPKKDGGGGEAVSKVTELKDKMCACKTPACAQGVAAEDTKRSEAMAKDPPKLSAEDAKKLVDLNQQFAKCLVDATAGTAPNPATLPTPEATGSGSATK